MNDNNTQLQLDKISYSRLYPLTYVTLLFYRTSSESLQSFLLLLQAAGFKSTSKNTLTLFSIAVPAEKNPRTIEKIIEEKMLGSEITVQLRKNAKKRVPDLLKFLSTHGIFCHHDSQTNELLQEGCLRYFQKEFLTSNRDKVHPIKAEREMLLREIERLEKYGLSSGKYLTPGEPVTGIQFTRDRK